MLPDTVTRWSNWHRLAAALILLVVLLGAWNWFLRPEAGASRWLRVMLTMPAVWGAMTLYGRWALRVRAAQPDEAVARYSQAAGHFFTVMISVVSLTRHDRAHEQGLQGAV
jgi:hypothetical protein